MLTAMHRQHIIPTLLLLLCTYSLRLCNSTAIDNEVVGSPIVNCGTDYIGISFQTRNPFAGRVFIKGYAYQAECSKAGSNNNADAFQIMFNQCGVRRSRQVNGLAITATVIISFHTLFLTKVDRAYRINCFYMEASKTVTQQLDVSMLTTQDLNNNVPMPVCRYDILQGDAQGPPVRFARIGDSVYHKWTCESQVPNQFCMRVHTCIVNDGQGGPNINVLDKDGCSIDRYVLQNLDYTTDLMAGQESHVYKFADRPALYYNCQVELKIRDDITGCTALRPQCSTNGGGSTQNPSTLPYNIPSAQPNIDQTIQTIYTQQPTNYWPQQTTGPTIISTTSILQSNDQYEQQQEQPSSIPAGPLLQPYVTQGPGSTVGQPGAQPYLQRLRQAFQSRIKRGVNNNTNSWHRTQQDEIQLRQQQQRQGIPVYADFDLPEKRIMVFDLDAVLDDPGSDETEANKEKHVLDLLTNRKVSAEDTLEALGMSLDEMVCMHSEKFVSYAVALVGVSITSIAILGVIFVRRKSLFTFVNQKST